MNQYPFAELLFLFGLSAMYSAMAQSRRPPVAKCQLTNPENGAISEGKPAPSVRRRQRVTPEAARFVELPPQLQRQLLRYGERWREGISR